MMAKPLKWSDDTVRWYSTPSPSPGVASGVIIECELVSPKSMKGRTVAVHLDGQDVVAVLKMLRQSAIQSRQ